MCAWSAVSKEWGKSRISQRLSDLPVVDQIGWHFIPISPMRLTFTSSLGTVHNATSRRVAKIMLQDETGRYPRNGEEIARKMETLTVDDLVAECDSARGKQKYALMIPFSDAYTKNRAAITRAFIEQVGFIQPLDDEITVEILLITEPEDKSAKSDLDNVQKTVFDAMDYRMKSADGTKLGIIADDSPICHVIIDKRDRREGERLGFWYRVTRGNLVDTGSFNKKLRNSHTTEADRSFASYVSDGTDSEKWGEKVDADEWAVKATTKQKEHMRLALMADGSTPLDPAIARYYLGVRAEFGRDVAAKFALDAQSEVALRRALGQDFEGLLADKDSAAADLAEDHDIDFSAITGPVSVNQLESMAA